MPDAASQGANAAAQGAHATTQGASTLGEAEAAEAEEFRRSVMCVSATHSSLAGCGVFNLALTSIWLFLVYPTECGSLALSWGSIIVQDWGRDQCSVGNHVMSVSDCETLSREYKASCIDGDAYLQKGFWTEAPPGCHIRSQSSAEFQFNLHSGSASLWHSPVCRLVTEDIGDSVPFQEVGATPHKTLHNSSRFGRPVVAQCYQSAAVEGELYRGGGLRTQQVFFLLLGAANIATPLTLLYYARFGVSEQNPARTQSVCFADIACGGCTITVFLLSLAGVAGTISLLPCVPHREQIALFLLLAVSSCFQFILWSIATVHAQRIYLHILVAINLPHFIGATARAPRRVRLRAPARSPAVARRLYLEYCLVILQLLPSHRWTQSECGGGEESQRDCSLCMDTFEEGQEVRTLPCRHCFHAACIDRWLLAGQQQSTTCPLCRLDLAQAVIEAERERQGMPPRLSLGSSGGGSDAVRSSSVSGNSRAMPSASAPEGQVPDATLVGLPAGTTQDTFV